MKRRTISYISNALPRKIRQKYCTNYISQFSFYMIYSKWIENLSQIVKMEALSCLQIYANHFGEMLVINNDAIHSLAHIQSHATWYVKVYLKNEFYETWHWERISLRNSITHELHMHFIKNAWDNDWSVIDTRQNIGQHWSH